MPDVHASAPRFPPQDVLHDQLADVWERMLAASPIGIDDDFFVLGGTRELGERMLGEVERLSGDRLEWSDTAAPTIRGLADVLVARLPRSPVLEVQAGHPGVVPLFYLHGDLGGAGYYVRELARGLGPHQPVHVLQHHGMHGDDIPASAEAMASDAIARLRGVHPAGAFHLGGYCAGAIVAFEMAQQLSDPSSGLDGLFLIDPSVTPEDDAPRPAMPRLSPAQRRAPRIRGAWLFGQYGAILQPYRLRPYAGDIAVLLARDGRTNRPQVTAMWESIAPRVRISTVPGTHRTAPGRHVLTLARELAALIGAPDVLPFHTRDG